MYKRVSVILLFAALLAASLSVAIWAQTTIPDEGVRGSGSIKTNTGLVGNLSVNVAWSGSKPWGGFKYVELGTTNTRGHTIYTQQILGLDITGSSAVIKADGIWNGMPAALTLEVRDGAPDWFRILAVPKGMILILYEQKGYLYEGDIVVYGSPQPEITVKGEGIIRVNRNFGKFAVAAQKTGNVVQGTIYYVEYNPHSTSIIERPKVKIHVPQVEKLHVDDFDAYLAGKGTFNGKPAWIEVKAKDGQLYPTFVYMPDEFHIKAIPQAVNTWSNACYTAGGELYDGEITIKLSDY